jgi:glycosyltransferase involved in cell wall biosynthesis
VVGGVESVIGHHSRLMAEAGHQVEIVAGRGAQVDQAVDFVHLPLADSQDPDILVLRSELQRGIVSDDFSKTVDALVESLARIAADADCLIAHNVCSLNKNLALTAALRKVSEQSPKLKLVLWHHDLAWTAPRYRAELHDGHPWDLLRTAWPGATQVTISDFRRGELAQLFGISEGLVRVIPNGLDVARFLKLEDLSLQFVERLNLMDAWPLLLLPVRITARKNIELALRVLAALKQDYPAAALVVTGPLGPHNPANRDYFAKLLALRAELGLQAAAHFLAELTAEFLSDDVISDFYRLADLLLLTSLEEGFGIPILEAGFSGVPVFCSDIPPLRELAASHAVYFPVDAAPATIAAEMSKYLASSAAFGLRARVRAEYTWERIYRKHISPLLDGSGG